MKTMVGTINYMVFNLGDTHGFSVCQVRWEFGESYKFLRENELELNILDTYMITNQEIAGDAREIAENEFHVHWQFRNNIHGKWYDINETRFRGDWKRNVCFRQVATLL